MNPADCPLRPFERLQEARLDEERAKTAVIGQPRLAVNFLIGVLEEFDAQLKAGRFDGEPGLLLHCLVYVAAVAQRLAEDLGLLKDNVGPPAEPPHTVFVEGYPPPFLDN
jgi:hypothetical protein